MINTEVTISRFKGENDPVNVFTGSIINETSNEDVIQLVVTQRTMQHTANGFAKAVSKRALIPMNRRDYEAIKDEIKPGLEWKRIMGVEYCKLLYKDSLESSGGREARKNPEINKELTFQGSPIYRETILSYDREEIDTILQHDREPVAVAVLPPKHKFAGSDEMD